MSEKVIYDPQKEAPVITITFAGTTRIEYGMTLNDPDNPGTWLGHWTGDNSNQDEVEYPKISERPGLPSPRWEFAGLDWLFMTRPNPGIQESYKIQIRIEQEGEELYLKEYGGDISNPKTDAGRVIFVPKV